MQGKLPDAILNRKKEGLRYPRARLVPRRAAPLLLDATLTPEALRRLAIFDAPAVEQLISDHERKRLNAGYHLWGLLTLFLWMKKWNIEVRSAGRTGGGDPRPSFRLDRSRSFRRRIYVSSAASARRRLMDDVDAVQAQIARNMLDSGDWVTARLDGVAYLEKSPLMYWMMAVSYHRSSALRLGRAAAAGAGRDSALLADGALAALGVRRGGGLLRGSGPRHLRWGCGCSRAS